MYSHIIGGVLFSSNSSHPRQFWKVKNNHTYFCVSPVMGLFSGKIKVVGGNLNQDEEKGNDQVARKVFLMYKIFFISSRLRICGRYRQG